ncbi:hypothetical protein GMORB2_3497 [Geosmithia morbida]|uniref:Uncharacterized protein n=1 Tax=Geosmithia morbida TaxID=1094350 RepID=A0A9P4YR56_9HYPO|nr:uncharacterized protein GMORB2_3497 [Geosmithia morbida]KAF4120086.1 hypothetical protein GMORB2_3497 [Geosmithia morbida]
MTVADIFSIDERLQQQHDNFMRQPNPDYAANPMADSRYDTDSEPEPKHEPEHRHCATPPTQPRRLLYNKTIPVGSPAQRPAAPSSYPGFFSAFRGSYPPANANTVSRGGPDGGLADGPREINVHGEIISMLDKNGTGWTRHTRVYGGGGCNTFPPTPEPSFYAPFPEETR